MLGVDDAALLRMSIADVISPERRDRALAEFGGLVETGRIEQEYELLRPDGRRIEVLLRAVTIGEDRYVAFCQDVTATRLAEAQLRESEGRFEAAFQGSPIAMAIAESSTGHYVEVNPAFLEASGYTREEVLGRNAEDLRLYCDPGDRAGILASLGKSDHPVAEEVRYRSRDGRIGTCIVSVRKIQLHGEPHVLSTVVDVTARKRAEDERAALQTRLGMASRIAALGTLVAGVAHEVNNPLAGALGSLSSALGQQRELSAALRGPDPVDRPALADEADEVVDALLDAEVGMDRIARIVKDLSLFGRPNPMRTRVRLGDVVTSAMRWLPASVGRLATVHVDDEGAPDVHASAGQLEQVVVNLVSNGARAIPEERRGEVRVRIATSPEGRAVLEVQDDGAGIDRADRERIFDPFFTTRDVGQGMGLGLPICHAIVTAHGGLAHGDERAGQGLDLPDGAPGGGGPGRIAGLRIYCTTTMGRRCRTNSATVSTSASVPVATQPSVQSKAVVGNSGSVTAARRAVDADAARRSAPSPPAPAWGTRWE